MRLPLLFAVIFCRLSRCASGPGAPAGSGAARPSAQEGAAVEPALERTVVEAVVSAVAGGRVKRRQLAQALYERPELLVQGRSPAPRGVGDLLIALRRAGALQISPPICAGPLAVG